MPPNSKQPSLNAYYIHAKLSNSKIVRDLLSHSRRGRAAARAYDDVRRSHEQQGDHESQRLLIMAECERLSVAFYEFVELVLDCEMLAAGYHYHRGEWRKRRVPKEEREQQNDPPANAAEQPAVPKRAIANRSPARRPMPLRHALDCRCPLVRGAVCRRRMVHRTRMPTRLIRRWVDRSLLRRRIMSGIKRPVRRWHSSFQRTETLGHANRPRPPPMAGVACG